MSNHKTARKSLGSKVYVSETTNTDPLRTTSPNQFSVSQNTTHRISLPSCSRDESDSDDCTIVWDDFAQRASSSVYSEAKRMPPVNRKPLASSECDSSDTDVGHVNKKQKGKTLAVESSDEDFMSVDEDGETYKKQNQGNKSSQDNHMSVDEDGETYKKQNQGNKSSEDNHACAQNEERERTSTSIPTTSGVVSSRQPTQNGRDSDDRPLASKCVSYICIANRKKTAIKKSDIIRHCFDDSNKKMFPSVMNDVRKILSKTFGFELTELPNRKNEYILCNGLDKSLRPQEFAKYPLPERQVQGFIFYLLTMIFMNGNLIQEDQLDKYLEPLGIQFNSKTHPVFGDVKKFVTEKLVKKLYLERKLVSSDPQTYELLWGPRAYKEVSKEECLKFTCKIMDSTEPEDWSSQYKEVEEEKDS